MFKIREEYFRPKRKKLVKDLIAWDGIYCNGNSQRKCWKRNKIKKQYMKHLC